MNLPSFAEFKKNQNAFYAFATILALIFIFQLWLKSADREYIATQESLKKCENNNKNLEKKVDILNEKLLSIVQKQQIKDSIK